MSGDIIEQLRQQERETEKRIDELSSMLDELAKLKAEHRKIRRAIAVLEGSYTAAPSGLGITDQVLKLLCDTDLPLRVAEIAEKAALDNSQVRSSIGYLRRQGKARAIQRGLWVAVR
jgi:hypothetical protein